MALSFKKIIIRTTKKSSYLQILQHATTRTEVDDGWRTNTHKLLSAFKRLKKKVEIIHDFRMKLLALIVCETHQPVCAHTPLLTCVWISPLAGSDSGTTGPHCNELIKGYWDLFMTFFQTLDSVFSLGLFFSIKLHFSSGKLFSNFSGGLPEHFISQTST